MTPRFTTPQHYPCERDRLRSLLTASQYTGDLSIDKALWWYADAAVGIFLEGAERAGFDTRTVLSFDDYCQVEALLRGPDDSAEESAWLLLEGARRAGLDPEVIQRFEEHYLAQQQPEGPDAGEVDERGGKASC